MNILDEIDSAEQGSAAIQRTWSPQQEEVFRLCKDPSQGLLISAVAGSGKTTTLIEAMKHSPGSTLFLAFNKAIAEDIKRKTFSGDVRTLNALGHSIWARNKPKAKLESRKTMILLKALMKDSSRFNEFGYQMSRLIGLAKNQALGIYREVEAIDFISIIDNYAFDIPFEIQEDIAYVCLEAFNQSNEDLESFDFDDQLYMPIKWNWDFPKYHNAFVDEAQDLSPIQHLILGGLAATARIVAVGDRFQAIYGFRGASVHSMDELQEKFSLKELPLSTTYRCGRAIVAEAQSFNPSIQACEGALEGEVLQTHEDPQLFPQSLIMCRNNAPLFKAILRHVRAKEPCQVLSNFLDTFQSFVRGFKTTYTSDLRVKLDNWFDRESEVCKAKNQKGKLAGLVDRYETVKLLSNEFKLTSEVIDLVKKLGTSNRGPIFSTIHKAKGLENEKAYIIRPDLMPAFYATTEEAKQQEANLQYVAITRAKEQLIYGACL
ncbi:unnamed protein product [Sphagnum balticum]